MIQDLYYVISSSDDSPINVELMTASDLKKALNQEDWGPNPVFHENIPDQSDGYFDCEGGRTHIVIIKGRIVVPEPVEKVTTYVIP